MPFTLLDYTKAIAIVFGVNLIAMGTHTNSFVTSLIGGVMLAAAVLPFRSR